MRNAMRSRRLSRRRPPTGRFMMLEGNDIGINSRNEFLRTGVRKKTN